MWLIWTTVTTDKLAGMAAIVKNLPYFGFGNLATLLGLVLKAKFFGLGLETQALDLVMISACFAPDDIPCCICYTGKSSFETDIEADSNDITEHPHDDKPRLYFCTVCDKRFTTKGNLNQHKLMHTGGKLCCCTQCGKRCANQYQLRYC